jgi:hypothetical protein
MVDLLFWSGADVNQTGGYYGTAIQAACWKWFDSITSTLIAAGADINLDGGHFGSPLQVDTNLKRTKMLPERGARVNTTIGLYGNPLAAAAKSNNVEQGKIAT